MTINQFSFESSPSGVAVTKYVTLYRRSGLPEFEVSKPLDLFPSTPPTGPWPYPVRAGVYLIYSASFDLLYVGKAQYLGERLSQHFGSGEICVIRGKWTHQPPRYVINIAVPTDMPFEAPALEAFLIGELQPSDNSYGK